MNMRNKMKKMNNEGFSLVELIIVIAIMVVLVGVIAPQYIKYVDKSKAAADMQVADSLQTAITVALMDPTITTKPSTATDASIASLTTTTDAFWKEVFETMNVSSGAELNGKLKQTGATLVYSIDASGNVEVKTTTGGVPGTSK